MGSVGRPFSTEPKSCYCIIEIKPSEDGTAEFEAKHNFVEYDFEKSAKLLEERNFIGADKMANMLRHATNRYPQ